jgi:flagellar biosynthetic protein FliR
VDQLSQYVWIGALLFARLGSVMMIAPGWGEASVPATFRLGAALLATFALAPTLAGVAPPQPATPAGMIGPIAMETLTGLLLGLGGRLMFSAVQVAGAIAGIASGLGFAQQVDPTMNEQAAIFSAFFSLMGVVLVMSAGLHEITLKAAADSYGVLPPGALPPIGDAVAFATELVSTSFSLGLQIAAPVVVFSLIFNLALGFASRLVPQVQMYMVATPLMVIASVAVIAIGLGGGLMVWLDEMERQARFFGRV